MSMGAATMATRFKREDHKRINHDCHLSKWKILIGPHDWEDHSVGKEGVARYRVENLPQSSSSGLYELAIYRTDSSNHGNLDPDKALVVYLGEADNVRTRLQQYGRTGAHFCRNGSGDKACGLLEDIFARGYSIVYRWAPMENKADARRTEARLLNTFDYAWNKGSNGVRRLNDILQKLDKHASNLTKPANFSRKQVCKFSRCRPRLVSDHGGSDKNDTVTCGVVLEDGSICRWPPAEGRKRCAEHKGKKTGGSSTRSSTSEKSELRKGDYPKIEHRGPICGVAMIDGSLCTRQPVSGRKRCDLHKGRRVYSSNSETTRYYEDSVFDKKSLVFDSKSRFDSSNQNNSSNSRSTSICGAPTCKGASCKRPVNGNERCWQHLNYSGSSSTCTSFTQLSNYGDSGTSICKRPVNGNERCWQPLNYSGSSSSSSTSFTRHSNYGDSGTSICGAPTRSGSLCQRTVKGNERCWQHLNYSGSSSTGISFTQHSNYGYSGTSICGAPTRSGAFCQRTVRGNGRCWQH